MKRLEIIFIIVALLGIAIYMLDLPGGTLLTTLSFFTITQFYLILSFAHLNNISFKEIFKSKSYKDISTWRLLGSMYSGVAFSSLIIGMLFKINFWPGAAISILSGLMMTLPVIIISTIKWIIKKDDFYKRILLRAGIFYGLAIFFFFLPSIEIEKLKYRHHPSYINAIEKLQEDPDNKELQENMNKEYDKMQKRK